MRVSQLTPVFVEHVPEPVPEGILYISVQYGTAVHKCCCGCGHEVVTPMSPTDWRLIFDGESVSLEPSIGNWSFPCRSHYWVTKNRVQWAPAWSREQVAAGRDHERLVKAAQYGEPSTTSAAHEPDGEVSWWRRLWACLTGRQ